jgi:hypothetical protein
MPLPNVRTATETAMSREITRDSGREGLARSGPRAAAHFATLCRRQPGARGFIPGYLPRD